MTYSKDELAKRRAQLTDEQRRLLQRHLRGEAGAAAGPEPDGIPRRPTDAVVPLSFVQERLWFLQQLDPTNSGFNEHRAIWITGNLNVEVLTQMARELIRRHELLRTSFRFVGDQLCQVIDPDLPARLVIPLTDLGALPAEQREAEARRLAVAEAQQPFDLAHGPMLRFSLLRLDRQTHVLLLTMHHIVYDGWSNEVLLSEVIGLYRAFAQGLPSPFPEPPVQYGDFALWQRAWLQGPVLERQLDYWRGQLGGSLPVLELPTDRPRPPMQQFQGASAARPIPAELAAALRLTGQHGGASLFMVLLAAFKVLLAAYTGQTDLIVGTYIAGRSRPELERLIGFFVNSLPLRSDLAGDPTFAELLQQIRAVTRGAYSHQDVPFELLVETLQPQRDPSRTPIYQAMLVLQNVPKPAEAAEGDGPHLRDWPIVEERLDGAAQCDLTLIVDELPDGGLRANLVYDTTLFEHATAERMLAQYARLLGQIAADSQRRISTLTLLDPAEQRLLEAWCAAEPAAPAADVLELFAAQVARAPDAPALADGTQTLSYGELNRQANQLAHTLIADGLGPEQVVGLLLPRSAMAVVGLLGVLKAGAAYLPLDPEHPAERLRGIARAAGLRLLLTSAALAARLDGLAERSICLDRDAALLGAAPDSDPAPPLHPEHPAYVIYTSGSTGTPKGVLVPRRALANFSHTSRAVYALQPGDRALQFANLVFDASVEEIFPTLISGATLVLRDQTMLQSPQIFLDTCRAWGITVLNLPTAYWHLLGAAGADAGAAWPERLRLVIIGGEAALALHWQAWRERLPAQVRLVNTYGPTETTVVATRYEGPARAGVPIGRPVVGTQAYVLDRHMRLAAPGLPGELYLGGVGLARGYLGRPDLTAERFVPNPFAVGYGVSGIGDTDADTYPIPDTRYPGARLYRTGDLARWLPDGQLEFLGRADQQVKIRGFRIELGEIEAQVRALPQVRQAVVLAREDSPGERRLVAYVVPADDAPTLDRSVAPALDRSSAQTLDRSVAQPLDRSVVPTLDRSNVPTLDRSIAQALQERLPDYMVPSAVVLLSELPLTRSGKIDRQALPAPESGRAAMAEPYAPPSTPIEERIVAIWEEVLKRSGIGVNDPFFALGGHSLLVTQVIHRISGAFEIDLPLRSLFEDPTVALLALRVEELMLDQLELEADQDLA